jgi:predicted metal-dependent enzyme (double-stranded beta helix superfamily)
VPAADPLPPDALGHIAAGIAAATPLWQAHAVHDPAERQPARLLATPRYEVWVIGWTNGQGVELHDHGDAAGVIAVTAGALLERTLRGDGSLHDEDLIAGRIKYLHPGTVHQVTNVGHTPATSIHVYSPPLTTMTHYDDTTNQPTHTEVIERSLPAITGAAGSAVLHPSGQA